MFPKTYFIKTFGCQMNVSDSERLAGFLESENFSPTDEITEADLVVFNTCGIKQTAENRAYSMINNLRKKRKRDTKIVMTGCLANRSDVQKRLKGKVDLFTEIKNFPENINQLLVTDYKLQVTPNKKTLADYFHIKPINDNKFTALVPIMTGCNNFCAYCVVPNARGREVSRSADEIINEVKGLVEKGYKHIFLLGQNVNSYDGKSQISNLKSQKNSKLQNPKNKNINFSQLLRKINALPGNFWISFVSSHPKDVTDEMIETVAKCKKVCENFHLPIQAGNDGVLKKMNRRYTAENYLKTIKKIKSAFKKHKPNTPFSISSDIIVGFPGETKKQFIGSAEMMKKVKFDMVFFGQFSPRPGTVAWKMKDNVSQKEKQRRENLLNEILKKTAFANNKKYVGKILEILIEKEKNDSYFGKTRSGKNVKIISKKKNLIGTIVKAKITKANIWNLEATIK